jgi:ABC-type sulfate transport system substrate-binding protein
MQDERNRGRNLVVLAILAAAFLLFAWLASRGGWLPATEQHRVLTIYSYSSLDEVMTRGIFPAFRAEWLASTGEKLEFVPTFSGSGEITDRILQRYPAEIAIVSSELDAYRLPIPFRAWKSLPHGGVLARTPLVIVTRPDNPLRIEGFADLGDRELTLIHGDPATSGAANLALVAIYSEALRESKDPESAFSASAAYWSHASIRVPSAREARLRFEGGEGDAFITYEQDVVPAPSRPAVDGELVLPPSTLLVEPIVAPIEKNITAAQRPLVEAFTAFLWSEEGQRILVEYGFHSVLDMPESVDPHLGSPENAVTLDDLGGATAVKRDILDTVWRKQILGQ